jgi:hypothetical protein
MNKSKVAIVISQIIEKIEMIAGGLWSAFMTMGLCFSLTDDTQDGAGVIITIIIIDLIGIWVFMKGLRRRKMRLTFRLYVTQLSANPDGQIENIAGATGTSVDVVKKNLKFMIKKRFFTNAYIDEQNNRLVLPSLVNQASAEQRVSEPQTAVQTKAPQQMITCNCKNCGGVNTIVKGSVSECDFCGSPLQG